MSGERIFSLKELLRYNGEDGPMYVAFRGTVYEVGDSRRWRSGMHENLHFPGQDLTDELVDAPHGTEVFSRPDIHIAGKLEPAGE